MRPSDLFKIADEMAISKQSAARMRIRYLLIIIDMWDSYIEGETNIMPPSTTVDALNEIIAIKNHEGRSKKGISLKEITDEMIQTARDYPIDQVIEFNKGVAMAFCHSDKSPSLVLWKKGNAARCFPCGKTFNPIDVLIERDSLTFLEAVKQLN